MLTIGTRKDWSADAVVAEGQETTGGGIIHPGDRVVIGVGRGGIVDGNGGGIGTGPEDGDEHVRAALEHAVAGIGDGGEVGVGDHQDGWWWRS